MIAFPSTRYKQHANNPHKIHVTIIGDATTHDALAADDWTSDLNALVETHPQEGAAPVIDYVPIQVQDVLAGIAAAKLPKPKDKAEYAATTKPHGAADEQVIKDEAAAIARQKAAGWKPPANAPKAK